MKGPTVNHHSPVEGSAPGIPRPIRAVIFDFGNVISHRQDGEAIERMAGLLGLSPGPFERLYYEHRGEYDRGTIDDETYWRILCRETGASWNNELFRRLLQTDRASWSKINLQMIQWVEQLRDQGTRTAILSNMPSSFYREVLMGYPWIPLFDAVVISGELGMVKPEVAIFDEALRRLGTSPEETLFIDDLAPNVEGARDAGLNALLFTDAATLGTAVHRDYGLPRVAE
ncbi:HAD family hydrolase [Salinispira pacifica]